MNEKIITEKDRFRQVSHFALLFEKCIYALLFDSVNSDDIALLKETVERFVEGKLHQTANKAKANGDWQALLSLHIWDTPLRERYVRELMDDGIIGFARITFVGELLLWPGLKEERGATNVHRQTHAIRFLLWQLGIPFDLELDNVNGPGIGWQPPYASEKETLQMWGKRLHDLDISAYCPKGGCITYGEKIRALGHCDTVAMYVPPSWKPKRELKACREHNNKLREAEGVALGENRDTTLHDLELSVRTHVALQNANVTTLAQLVVLTEADVLKISGRRTLLEIREVLGGIGLHLGMQQ